MKKLPTQFLNGTLIPENYFASDCYVLFKATGRVT